VEVNPGNPRGEKKATSPPVHTRGKQGCRKEEKGVPDTLLNPERKTSTAMSDAGLTDNRSGELLVRHLKKKTDLYRKCRAEASRGDTEIEEEGGTTRGGADCNRKKL